MFDTSRPGRDGSINVQTTPTRKSKEGQKGIISCISFNPDRSGLFAIGSFSGSFGLYDANNNDPVLLIRDKAAVGSVTQVQFSLDGHRLFLAARQSDHIDCWDIRNMGEKLYSLYRLRGGRTNQRIGFSLDTTGNVLATGDLDGSVRYFDVSSSGSSSRSSSTIAANDSNDARLMAHVENTHADCVAVASFHPSMAVLATGSGQRRYHHELDQTMLKLASSSSSSTSTSLEDLDKSTSYECSVKAHAFQYKAV